MSLFSDFPSEFVRIIKQDQSTIENVKAIAGDGTMLIPDGSLDIEEGDIIQRALPTGKKEEYLVEDRGFYKGFHDIPDHYQVKVRKQTSCSVPKAEQTSYSAPKAEQNYYTYNIGSIENSGKINFQSTDNSSNTSTSNITANDLAIMDTLRSLAKGLENESEILKNIDEMQNNAGESGFLEKYNNFIQSVANHMTAFGPFIPILTKMLMQ